MATSKTQFFSYYLYFTFPLRVLSLEFCSAVWLKKPTLMGLADGWRSLMENHFDFRHMPQLERRIDRQTDGRKFHTSILTREKNICRIINGGTLSDCVGDDVCSVLQSWVTWASDVHTAYKVRAGDHPLCQTDWQSNSRQTGSQRTGQFQQVQAGTSCQAGQLQTYLILLR